MNTNSPRTIGDAEGFPSPLSAIPRREAPAAEVTRRLLDYLLSGHITSGQKIPPERQLAQVLHVGRSAVREAIKSLSLLGLLDVRQGDGTYLTGHSSDLLPRVIEWGLLLGERRVQDLMEVRTHLEITVAGLAAERHTEEQVANLRRLLDEMEHADGEIPAYVEADLSLHLAIAEASGNQVLASLLGSIRSLLRVWATRVLEAAGEVETSLAVHVPIVDAIERGDADAARVAMTAHMARATRRLQASVGEQQASTTRAAG
jgi:GntR family transcriptional repressor for pyruvate dehydrogenase complex